VTKLKGELQMGSRDKRKESKGKPKKDKKVPVIYLI
jgi:hypothetical protein